uniref:Uncharacterized protein n=1 Tax=Arundo donax TaxID=35708 RepID=A0A0A9HD77_ARUDO
MGWSLLELMGSLFTIIHDNIATPVRLLI